MKHGTAYAKKLKRFYAKVKKVECPPELVEPTDPLEQLVLSTLGLECSRVQARRALDKLLSTMVDLNEIRVSPPRQVAALISAYLPNSLMCAIRLCGVLNAVFSKNNTLRLDSLRSLGKREARQKLENLNGIEPYCLASVFLWSLGGHAVPVNTRGLEALRREGVVEPSASLAEVQAFLERHVSPAEAKVFCLSIEHHAAQTASAKLRPQPAASGTRETQAVGRKHAAVAKERRKIASKG